jgi:hypothetical protein
MWRVWLYKWLLDAEKDKAEKPTNQTEPGHGEDQGEECSNDSGAGGAGGGTSPSTSGAEGAGSTVAAATTIPWIPVLPEAAAAGAGEESLATASASFAILVGAALLTGDSSREDRYFYHYTDASPTSFVTGLRGQSFVTDVGSYSSMQASAMLGIRPPNYVVTILDQGNFIPFSPGTVTPSRYGPGGGSQWTNPVRVPPTQIVNISPVPGGKCKK